jgi:hypothetical protein
LIYYFEENQKLKIVAYDADEFGNPNLDVSKANFIGDAEFDIQKLVSSRNKQIEVSFQCIKYF